MSKNNINDLIETLKEQGQDFEFYPTTEEIIDKIVSSILKCYDEDFNILDIGAGNASVLSKIEEKFNLKNPNASLNKYAIEKSEILIEQMPRDVAVIGTDFYETSLIEKSYFQVVFCNPPFKEYEAFASRIIKEINANRIYLVLPKRWRSNENIKKAIYSRKDTLKEQKSLGFFSFVNAQRKARAKVEIVEFSFKKESFDSENDFFLAKSLKEYFNIDLDTLQGKLEKEEELQRTLQEKIREIDSKDLINELVGLYNEEFKRFNEALASFNNIPKSILASLNIDKSAIVEAIRGELKSIKFVFWREIFSRLDSINERLIPKHRLDLARKFADLNIDFTYSNIKSACIYVIKNANYYVDLGVLDLFDDFTEEGALEYKSNKKFIFSSWRHSDDKFKAKKLDYRVVYNKLYNKLSYNNIREFIDKLFTIAKVLGFMPYSNYSLNYSLINHYQSYDYISGQFKNKSEGDCFFINHNKEEEIFFSFRAYKNGNLHFKFNKEFIAYFNIAVGRLRKWINNKAEAKVNFPECKEEIIDKAFLLVDEMQIKKNDIKLLN